MPTFEEDPKDRKRRFLRGLNVLLGHEAYEDKDIPLSEARKVSLHKFRQNLVEAYCLELTPNEISNCEREGMTTGEFTEIYCDKMYEARGKVGLNELISNSAKVINNQIAIDLAEMDNAPKYGINGGRWCDVAKGPCSCGAWHK